MIFARNARRFTIEDRCCLWTDAFVPPWRHGEQVVISAVGSKEYLQPVLERVVERSPGVRFVLLSDAALDWQLPRQPLHPGYGGDLQPGHRRADSVLFVTGDEEHPHHRNALFFLSHRLRARRSHLCQQYHVLLDITRHTRTPRVNGRSLSTFTWVEPGTWRYLYRAARDGHGSGVALEVGCYVGGTTLALAQGSRDGHRGLTVAVDHVLTEAYRANLAAAGLDDAVLTMETSSREAALAWPDQAREHGLDPALRLLMLDGDHSHDGVRDDLELWSPYVEPGGLLVAHDYYNPFHQGVARAVTEHLEHHGQWRIVHSLQDAVVCQAG